MGSEMCIRDRNILPFLLECKSEIEAAEHMRRVAQRLTIDEGLIVEEYRKATKRNGVKRESAYVPVLDVKKISITRQAEEQLLAVLLEEPYLADNCQVVLQYTGWSDPVLAQIFAVLQALVQANTFTIDKLNDALDGAGQSALAGIRTRAVPTQNGEQFVEACLRQLQRNYLEQEYEKHRLLADEYERSADERFMQELQETQRIKDEIKKLYG